MAATDPQDPARAPTTEELRHDTDRGKAQDKVDWSDPASVPLGADAEAAGFSPTPIERRMEAKARPQGAAPGDRRPGLPAFVPLLMGAALLIAVVAAYTL